MSGCPPLLALLDSIPRRGLLLAGKALLFVRPLELTFIEVMHPHLRIARPVSDLKRSVDRYRKGLGLQEIGGFENHEGFDGVMLGHRGATFHFEFTFSRTHTVMPTPTPEDLFGFYLPAQHEWKKARSVMLESGFAEAAAFNPHWQQRGRTFEVPRTLLHRPRTVPMAHQSAPMRNQDEDRRAPSRPLALRQPAGRGWHHRGLTAANRAACAPPPWSRAEGQPSPAARRHVWRAIQALCAVRRHRSEEHTSELQSL